MQPSRIEQRTENLERRVDRIEQVLPTLATKADLKATEERMQTHVAGAIADAIEKSERRMQTHVTNAIAGAIERSEQRMQTHVAGAIADAIEKSERRMQTHVTNAIAESEQRTRTHFDVVAESLRDDIRLVAEAVAALSDRER